LNPKRTNHDQNIKENLLRRFNMTEEELIYDIEIKAVMIWSDVDLFEVHLQVISDLLISEDGRINQNIKIGNAQKIKMYYSNEDLTYPNQVNIPRHAGGVFKIALESVFFKQYQREIISEKYGKPNTLQYKYAEECIEN
jgi:ribonucleotide monophosphatase NagD (HAD superfamily)